MKEVHGDKQLSNIINTKFQSGTYEEWVNAANKALKGKTISEFYRSTYENITIKPLYTKEDLPENYENLHQSVKNSAHWQIAQLVPGYTINELNKNMIEAIGQGQNTISFRLLNSINNEAVNNLFDHIDIENLPFFIDGDEEVLPFYAILHEGLKGYDRKENISGFIGMDPIATSLKKGFLNETSEGLYSIWTETIQFASQQFPNLKTIHVDGTIYEKVGGNAVQQLAFSLASAVEHIEQLKKVGLTVEDIISKMVFGFSIGSDFFMEIAKLRAARYLWTKITEIYKTKHVEMDVFAATSIVNKSKLDPYTNMLRSGGEAFAAVLGQIQTLRITPYDEVFGACSSLGTRLARNIHHLLREEAKLSVVTDPARGSYFIETLTTQLVEEAWHLFLEIETLGGMLSAINAGKVQEKLTEMKRLKELDIQQRKRKLIGTNQYVDPTERLHQPFEVYSMQHFSRKLKSTTFNSIIESVKSGANIKQFFDERESDSNMGKNLATLRLSEPYEKLRYEVLQFEKSIGKKPIVTLVYCSQQDKKGIEETVTEILRGAGITTEVSYGKNYGKILKETGNKLYCFCGSDQDLEDGFNDISELVQKYPDKGFIIAGLNKRELQMKFEQIGVRFFIHDGINQVHLLEGIVRFLVRGDQA